MDTIYVAYKPILGGLVYHTYTVYERVDPTTGQVSAYTLDARAEINSASGDSSGLGFSNRYGEVAVFERPWNETNPNWEGGAGQNHYRQEVARGEDLSAQWNAMRNYGQQIQDAPIRYSPVAGTIFGASDGGNCNTFTAGALQAAGISKPYTQQDLDAPGINSPLQLPPSPPSDGSGSNAPPGPSEGGYADDADEAFGDGEEEATPLVLDLDGDGLDLIALADSRAFFDLDNDGFAERTGWVGPDDALLALDRNGNGRIDGQTELFGGSPSDGFASLRTLDANADGTVDAADAGFADLRLWRDLNGDGVSQAAELQSLAAASIASLSLASTHLATPQDIAGNSVTDLSTFTRTDGTTATLADVWFALNQRFTFDMRPVTIADDALYLPTLRGYGTISSLTAQMSRDPTLLGMVRDLATGPLDAITDDQVRAILYRWAGVDGVDPASRGNYIDARQLAFLERFFDDPYLQEGFLPNPGVAAAATLEHSFDLIFDAAKARLLVQGPLAEAFGPGAFDYLHDRFAGVDMQAAIGQLQAGAPTTLEAGLAHWATLLPVLDAVAADVAPDDARTEGWLDAALRATTGYAFRAAELRGDATTLLHGTAAAETVTGGAGRDILVASAGNDLLKGAAGDDFVLFGHGSGQDRVSETGGTDSVLLGAGIAQEDVLLSRAGLNSNDLVLTVRGTADSLTVVGHFAPNPLGDYTAVVEEVRFADGTAWTYADILARLTAGTEGADTLFGDQNANAFGGAGGADKLYGRAGNDTLDGGAGNDTLDGNEDDDLLLGGEGNDSLLGGTPNIGTGGNDTLDSGAGNDTLNGARGDDLYLFGRGSGQDRIAEGWTGGNDAVLLGAGIAPAGLVLSRAGSGNNDLVVSVAGTADQLTAVGHFALDPWGSYSSQMEELRFADGTVWSYTDLPGRLSAATAGNDTLLGDGAANALDGAAGNDRLEGLGDADTLQGAAGNDSLYGGEGDDILLGGAGADRLEGGAGADAFRFLAASDSTSTGKDTIADLVLAQGDRIDLAAIDADTLAAGDQGFAWLGVGAAFTGVRGQLAARVVGTDLEVLGDVDGNGVADLAILVKATTTLTASAFLL